MKYIATFDIGTTAIKGVLVSDDKQVALQKSIPIATFFYGANKEQAPESWYKGFCAISRSFWESGFAKEDIRGIIMSGQMQDLIPVDEAGKSLRPAILYSDARADVQSEWILNKISAEKIAKITGNAMNASIPAAKLLWFREREAELFARTGKILVSPKDYCIAKLCGRFVADVTSASTFGLMDIHNMSWSNELLEALNIPAALLPEIHYCHEIAGEVLPAVSDESGYAAGTPVYVGSGDAGASTLASGVSKPGEYNIYLGTSGWIASVSDDTLDNAGVFNLAAIPSGVYINVVPFLNAGGVHKWISTTLAPEGQNKYDYIDGLLSHSRPGSGGVLFLPYLSGERFPVMDAKVRGSYFGIDNATTKNDLARACIEGVAFSIRQGLEAISRRPPDKITLVGGGAKTPVWRQILADVFNQEIFVFNDTEYLPPIALASAVRIAQGLEQSYDEFVTSITNSSDTMCYKPNQAAAKLMQEQFEKFQKLYACVREIY